MNTKVYEKTRYQNIYRHKKNKNYLVMISKPVKTSISSYNGKKILKLEEALAIRDNPTQKIKNTSKNVHTRTFDCLWYDYITDCQNVRKLAKNSIIRKNKTFNKYLKGVFYKKVNKIEENDFTYYIEKLKCTDKTKNEIIKEAKAFFNWCVKEKIIAYNPIANVSKYKVLKSEMKYWQPEEIKKFFDTINNDLENNINREIAYRTKMFVLIAFSLGARPGEVLNLRFNDFNFTNNTLSIKGTKTKTSDRIVDVSAKLISDVETYWYNLINEFDYDILEDSLIFANHKTGKQITDTTIRKHFDYYIEKANVSKIRLHDLRHTFVATAMSENKELYLISQRIGHSSYNTTVDKYGHLSNKIRKEIAELTDKYV